MPPQPSTLATAAALGVVRRHSVTNQIIAKMLKVE
jgi:hypothetical protein